MSNLSVADYITPAGVMRINALEEALYDELYGVRAVTGDGGTLNEVHYRAMSDGATPPLTLNEADIYWLGAQGITEGTLNERWHQFFTDMEVPSGTLGGRWSQFLHDRGYEGTLNEMMYQWFNGGAQTGFCVADIVHSQTDDVVFLRFTGDADSADASGYTVKINDVETPILG